MILSAIFVFTAVVTILNVFKLVSIIVGNEIEYPGRGWLRPTHWGWMYPSALYQMWFWSTTTGII